MAKKTDQDDPLSSEPSSSQAINNLLGFWLHIGSEDQLSTWKNLFAPLTSDEDINHALHTTRTAIQQAVDESFEELKKQKNKKSKKDFDASDLWFDLNDKIFLILESMIRKFVGDQKYRTRESRKSEFLMEQLLASLNPENFLATNKAAIELAISTNSESLKRGLTNQFRDLQSKTISQSDRTAFTLGKNIAATKGQVIYQNDLIELIQYQPQTNSTFRDPLLIVPPFINKYYILDLQKHNSFVDFCVTRGINTFIISWKNISEDESHFTWDHYAQDGVKQALAVVQKVFQKSNIHALGYCVGGTLLTSTLAVLPKAMIDKIFSLTLLASMIDFSDAGDLSLFITEEYISLLDKVLEPKGVFPGWALNNTFSALRPNELVWRYVQSKYLRGETPAPHDILHWNGDSTNLAGPCLRFYLRNMYLEDRFKQQDGITVLGRPVDVGTITSPCMVIAAERDHIVPWRASYQSRSLLGSKTEFLLTQGGHVAGVVNAPGQTKYGFYTNSQSPLDLSADEWLETASFDHKSWWEHWISWVVSLQHKKHRARGVMGNTHFRPFRRAPGEYVLEELHQ